MIAHSVSPPTNQPRNDTDTNTSSKNGQLHPSGVRDGPIGRGYRKKRFWDVYGGFLENTSGGGAAVNFSNGEDNRKDNANLSFAASDEGPDFKDQAREVMQPPRHPRTCEPERTVPAAGGLLVVQEGARACTAVIGCRGCAGNIFWRRKSPCRSSKTFDLGKGCFGRDGGNRGSCHLSQRNRG